MHTQIGDGETAQAPGAPIPCPYRTKVRFDENGTEFASCGLASEATGVSDPEVLAVRRGVCELCVQRRPKPDPKHPNPIAASLIYVASERIIERGGLAECDLEKAEKLMRWAAQHLDLAGKRADLRVTGHDRRDACLYLGEHTGMRPCLTCKGSVRQKVFRCTHEAHEETTVLDCARCPDHEGRLAPGSVGAWAVGVTTAPRKEVTLERSLRSLEAAGWRDALVFAEPDSEVPDWLGEHQLVRRNSRLGAWPNFMLSLQELVLRYPWADAYLLCQDDVLYSRDLRAYLEKTLWPSDKVGVVSLHTALHQEDGSRGFFTLGDKEVMAWGAQAYVFPNPSARGLLRSGIAVNHRHRGPRHGLCNIDTVVGQWCELAGLPYFMHSPSPTQHVGDSSAIWGEIGTAGRRHAGTFAGEAESFCKLMGEPVPENSVSATQKPDDLWQAKLAICSPLIGRRDAFVPWKRWLLEAELPPNTRLCILDNSGDPEFAELCCETAGEFAESGRFEKVKLHIRRHPPEVPPRHTPARHWCVADAYNTALKGAAGDEQYVFLLDDDTIPPADAMRRLFDGLADLRAKGERPGVISGCYESAGNRGHLVAGPSTIDWSHQFPMDSVDGGGLKKVGIVGSGCMLLDGELFWGCMPVRGESMRGVPGPDTYLSHEAARRGYSVWLHCGVHCDHLAATAPEPISD